MVASYLPVRYAMQSTRDTFLKLEDIPQVTLDIAQDLLSHSLFVRLIHWSADARRNRVLLTSHSAGMKIRPQMNIFCG